MTTEPTPADPQAEQAQTTPPAPAPGAAPGTQQTAPAQELPQQAADTAPKTNAAPAPQDKPTDKSEPKTQDAEPRPSEWQLDMPEGVDMTDAQRDRLNAYAAEHGLSQSQVQAGLPVFERALRENMVEAYNGTLRQYEEAAKADPVIGGEKFAAAVGQAEAAVKRLGAQVDAQGASDGGAQALEVLRTHGMLSHPAVVRLLKAADDATRDDRGVTGQSAKPAADNMQDVFATFYPKSQPPRSG